MTDVEDSRSKRKREEADVDDPPRKSRKSEEYEHRHRKADERSSRRDRDDRDGRRDSNYDKKDRDRYYDEKDKDRYHDERAGGGSDRRRDEERPRHRAKEEREDRGRRGDSRERRPVKEEPADGGPVGAVDVLKQEAADGAAVKAEEDVKPNVAAQENGGTERRKRRRWDSDEKAPGTGAVANGSGLVGAAAPAAPVAVVPLNLDALAKAKAALQKQKELAERLKRLPQLNRVATPPVPGVPLPPVIPAVQPTIPDPNAALLAAQQRAAMLGLAIPGSLSAAAAAGALAGAALKAAQPSKAPVLRLDHLGREIDEEGNVVEQKKLPPSELKVNINKAKKDKFKILRPDLDAVPEDDPFFDPALNVDRKKILRPRRAAFQFVEEGKWSQQAEAQRLRAQFGEQKAKEMKARQALMEKEREQAAVNPNLIEVTARAPVPEKQEKPKDPIPDVEWWDAPLLLTRTYADVRNLPESEFRLREERITHLVEHPVPIEPETALPPPPPQPLKLTKKEQKKLRHQARMAREAERQELVRQGLLEPPKNKVKISNFMRVMGADAVQDPTALEKQVRNEQQEREGAHADRNLARKLTPAERREKKNKKLFEDMTLETIVSLYRVSDLRHPQHQYKVDINAQENRLTGVMLISDAMSVVLVEGGTKSNKRYQKLMLHRINWTQALEKAGDDDDADEELARDNKCVLVWQGSVLKPAFERFMVHKTRTEAAARKFLEDAGVGHYWDLAANFVEE